MKNKINFSKAIKDCRQFFVVIFLLIGISLTLGAQNCPNNPNGDCCNSDGCNCGGTKNTYQTPSSILSPTSSWQTIPQRAGEYSVYQVCAGVTYKWTYCNLEYSGASAVDNIRIVLFNSSGSLVQCEDGGKNAGGGDCDGAPCIDWTAPTSGTVEIHTYRYVSFANPCSQSSTASNTLAFKAVSGPTPATPNAPNSDSPNCGNVTITRSGSPPSCTAWCWQTSSSGTSTSDCGSSYTTSQSGTYYLRARHTQTDIWSNSTSISVTVKTNSTAPSSASASQNPICSGSTTLTRSGGSLGTGASWEWYSGSCGGAPAGSGNSINVSPTSTTTYYVRAEGDCNTTSCANVPVTVNPSPNVSIQQTCQSGGSARLDANGANAYSWSNGNTGSTITVYNDGNYSVTGTSSNCTGTASAYVTIVNPCVGIENIISIQKLNLFPNPTTGMFTVEMELNKPVEMKLRVLNIIGKVVYEETLNDHVINYKRTIDLSSYSKGEYILQLISNEGLMSRKIIMQ